MRLFAVCLFVGLIVSCSEKEKIPSSVIGKEKMEKVLWDMIKADRYSTQFLSKDSASKINLQTKTFELYEQVFQIHGITREEFVKSFKYYLHRPDISRNMFDSISTRANRMKGDVYKPS